MSFEAKLFPNSPLPTCLFLNPSTGLLVLNSSSGLCSGTYRLLISAYESLNRCTHLSYETLITFNTPITPYPIINAIVYSTRLREMWYWVFKPE